MSKLLTSRGYRVTAVNNGGSAIRALQENAYDVVVLDLKMPGMDGSTTLKEIQKVVESPSAAFSLFGKGKGKKRQATLAGGGTDAPPLRGLRGCPACPLEGILRP